MKIVILTIMTLSIGVMSWAFDVKIPPCPPPNYKILEVVQFTPSKSADPKYIKGTCEVKVTAYSWWDSIPNNRPYENEATISSPCNPKNLIRNNNKLYINALVSYRGEISRCGSNPGCYYECLPAVWLETL